MVKFRAISAAIILSLMTGCGTSGAKVSTNPGAKTQVFNDSEFQVVPSKPVQATPSPTPMPTPMPAATPAPTPTPAPLPAQPPSQKAVGERLNFEMLDKLDNTKYSWWIRLNKNHEPSSIDTGIRKLIDRHDGIYIGDTTKKVIYLTFDEGYENGYTGKILDTLKANNVKSIFFVTAPYIKENADLVKRMLEEGHLVGNHTINHPSLPTVSNSVLENELYGLEKLFGDKFKKGFKYMRPPMGEYSERVLAAAKQLGYKTIFWSYAYKDYDVNDQKGADYAHKMVMDHLHNGAVYLLHAVSKDNAEALDRIIKDIKAQGYTISAFDL